MEGCDMWVDLLDDEDKVSIEDVANRWQLTLFQAFGVVYKEKPLFFNTLPKSLYVTLFYSAEEAGVLWRGESRPTNRWYWLFYENDQQILDSLYLTREAIELQELTVHNLYGIPWDFDLPSSAEESIIKISPFPEEAKHIRLPTSEKVIFKEDFSLNMSDLYMCKVDVISFEKERGIGPNTSGVPAYLDSTHSCYSHKLAAAIHAWEAVSSSPEKIEREKLHGRRSSIAPIQDWLIENSEKCGLIHKGKPNKTAIEEITKVANWKFFKKNS
jgi:hypothetical protein